MIRHLASLRSICETLPGVGGKRGDPHCTCGAKCDDPVHFTTKEYNVYSKHGQITKWRGLTVYEEDLTPKIAAGASGE